MILLIAYNLGTIKSVLLKDNGLKYFKLQYQVSKIIIRLINIDLRIILEFVGISDT